jgi:GNAT superfamily N-acetyltransferase
MLEIRRADLHGVAVLLQWARDEGWNPGLDDALPFHRADPEGFLLGFESGVSVSGISVVASGAHFGFLGLYIVHPAHRGKGYGWQTWQAGMARLAGRTIGLDGVVAQQANYARSGFAMAHRSIRFCGKMTARGDDKLGTLPIQSNNLPDIIAFDAGHYGSRRAEFITSWLDGSGGRRGLRVARDGQTFGYGVIRPCHSGFKIGPLFANTPDIAETLFTGLIAVAGGEDVSIDMPEPNVQGVRMMQRLGFSPIFETARMYRGPAPALPLQNIYGLTSFELG